MEFEIDGNVLTHFVYGQKHDFHEEVLVIPDGVKKIVKGADDEIILRQYRTLVLPKSLASIEDGALIQLRRLKDIRLERGSKLHYIDGCLYSSDRKNLIASVNGMNDLSIPEGCEKIYEGAFLFRDVKAVYMPDTIKMIGKRCFLSCLELNWVTLSNRLTEIPFGTFVNCEKLDKLFIPNSVSRIENDSIPNTTKMVFHAGSVAEDYAEKHSMNFEKLLY